MARKQDYAKGSGPMFDGKTPGSKKVGGIPTGVGGAPSTGDTKAAKDVGWPGVSDSTPKPTDTVQSAK